MSASRVQPAALYTLLLVVGACRSSQKKDIIPDPVPDMPQGADLVHVPQRHKVIDSYFQSDPVEREKVVRSQYQILRFLMKHGRNSRVLLEGLGDYFDLEISEHHRLKVKGFFADGVPERFEDLTEEQRQSLFHPGGTVVAAHLGIIKQPEQPTSMEDFEVFRSKILMLKEMIDKGIEPSEEYLKGLGRFLFDEREQMTKEKVMEVLKNKTPGSAPVILVYGGDHDFRDEFAYLGDRFKRLDGISWR